MLKYQFEERAMARYKQGDFVKAVFKDDRSGETERMWIVVDTCDDEKQLVFGKLDNEPIAAFLDKLWLGKDVAISYDLIVDHRKSVDFDQQS